MIPTLEISSYVGAVMLISITISWISIVEILPGTPEEGRGHETCPVQRHFVMFGYLMLLGRFVKVGSACETIIQNTTKIMRLSAS